MDGEANKLSSKPRQYEEGPTTSSVANKDDPERFLFSDEVEECECFNSEEECDCDKDANTGEKCHCLANTEEKCHCHSLSLNETDDLDWITYLRLTANQFGKFFVAAIIFIGGGLAGFFGINVDLPGAMKSIAMIDVDKLQIVGERNKLRRSKAAMLLTDVEINLVQIS